ncbi:membrane protein [Amylibacter ulvae]|uniref:Membrane protein n=1 Tax=Paramylibacter ulvae TaxID=1651968 RepID=A0ABQ3CUK6_9RHOB|nr:membrane protein [Amylibacter ulvae]
MVLTTTPKPAFEFALLGVLALLWGSSYLFLKIAVTEIPPITLIACRVSIAAVFLMGVMAWRRDQFPRDAQSWRKLFIQSFFNSFGAWVILAWGQQFVDSGLASVLNSTSPIFVFFITLFITRHEPTNPLRFIGAVLGLFGVVLIIGVDVLAGLGQQVAGQLAALMGAFLYGIAAIYGKRLSHLSAPVTATCTMIWAVVVLWPLAFVLENPTELRPTAQAIGATLMLSVFCTGFALLIYFRLLKTLGSMGVASQAYLRAGVGVMLGVIFLGETITPMVGVGLILVLLGIIAINMRPRQRTQL